MITRSHINQMSTKCTVTLQCLQRMTTHSKAHLLCIHECMHAFLRILKPGTDLLPSHHRCLHVTKTTHACFLRITTLEQMRCRHTTYVCTVKNAQVAEYNRIHP